MKKWIIGNSLADQWLRLGAFIARIWVQSLVGELRSRTLHATKPSSCNEDSGQPNINTKNKPKAKTSSNLKYFGVNSVIKCEISVSAQLMIPSLVKEMNEPT